MTYLPYSYGAEELSKYGTCNNSNIASKRTYIPITSNVLSHIIGTTELIPLEKLYYLLADSLALINFSCNKQRAIALAADSWAKKLNCSKSQIFTMQKNLVNKGYFIICKDKNIYGQNNRNLIYPTLPDHVFANLCESPNRINKEHLPYINTHESKREYLDRSKLFISIGYRILKELCSHKQLNPFYKLIWLDLYTGCYKKYITNRLEKPTASFTLIISTTELTQQYDCDKRHLSKALITLETEGWIKREHFYLKKETIAQGRQDKSLWKITLLFEIFQLGLKYDSNIHSDNSGSVYLSKTSEQYTTAIIPKLDQSIDNVQENKEQENIVAYSDPDVHNSSPYYNKNLKLKIKDIKSNLRATPKVLFNKFLRRFKQDNCSKNEQQLGTGKDFNIYSELIREKLKILPKDKADKARKFAYSLVSKGLATGYAASLNKHQLAKQLIHHAASWKPTKLGNISRAQQIDTALAVAWKEIIAGTWQIPLELAKAEILQHEFSYYRQKYQESGILSYEIKSLELAISSLLKRNYDLAGIITKAARNLVDHVSNAEDLRNLENVRSVDKPFTIPFNRADRFGAGTISSEVPANKDYQLEWDSCQPYQPISFSVDSDNQMDCQVVEKLNNYNFDLSHLTEEQTYLKISGNEQDDLMSIITTNRKEYFVQLKVLEINQQGELVMTLKPGVEQYFARLFIENEMNKKINY